MEFEFLASQPKVSSHFVGFPPPAHAGPLVSVEYKPAFIAKCVFKLCGYGLLKADYSCVQDARSSAYTIQQRTPRNSSLENHSRIRIIGILSPVESP
jgi:hypothetical protein